MEKTIDLTNPMFYENRELSWLKFNLRVLNESRDKSIPLFERLKFMSITSSNLDEFFMVRVASLKDMVHAGYKKPDIAGMTATEQLVRINAATRELVGLQYSTYNRSLIPLMTAKNMHIINAYEDLTKPQKIYVDRVFEQMIYPVLTPMAVDASRPFPLIRNKSLNIAAFIRKKDVQSDAKDKKTLEFATVQVPSVLPRLIEIPGEEGGRIFILLEQIIERNMEKLFLNYKISCAFPYRIMRNADLPIDEDEAEDLLKEIQKQLKKRQWGEVIRLEIEEGVAPELLEVLKNELHISDTDIYKLNGPLDLTFLMKLYGQQGFDEYKNSPSVPKKNPRFLKDDSIFDEIKRGDILLHLPYESFDPVVDFVKSAAADPDVLAIKQTLYRVSGNSSIVNSLAQAAENGKQVTVLVELKARFDEENNIVWAKKLEKAGCHVIYGLVGLKTHSKITLVVRKEEEGIHRYVHLGTGNYNDSTAKLYTDCGIFTCSEQIGEDATAVFNMLSGYSEPLFWNELTIAPLWLRKKFLQLIERETLNAKSKKSARIIAKMNSLCDPEIIQALYIASSEGVQIDLIIRGICSLRVGIPGISENIHVHSIVGNFLEHSRIFYFENNNNPEIFMASADWMQRNLDRRVEILFPIEQDDLKQKVIHILDVQLQDNTKAYLMGTDGAYYKVDKRGKVLVNSQEQFTAEADAADTTNKYVYQKRVFTPAESIDLD
ncbi:MAG: RNA degradosome polyphosphate kinase [Lachnospiraceae bacterium]